MKVKLVNYPSNIILDLLVIWYQARKNPELCDEDGVVMKSKIQEVMSGQTVGSITPEKLFETVKMILITPSMSLKRHVSLTFVLHDVPVALREQLVRHQSGNHFWVRSSRIDDLSYANYYVPDSLDDPKKEMLVKYYDTLNSSYRDLLLNGVDPEDAKMIMPESRLHEMSWTCTLDALTHVTNTRSCWFAQEFWIDVNSQIKRELAKAVDSSDIPLDIQKLFISSFATPPCSASCSKDCNISLDMLEKLRGDIKHPVCPIFIKKYSPDNKVMGYPLSANMYKTEYSFDHFKEIWTDKFYRDTIDEVRELIGTPLSHDDIEKISKETK